MEISDDPVTLALGLGTLLVVGLALALPVIIRVIRMRRFERMLGRAHWPFVIGVDTRRKSGQDEL